MITQKEADKLFKLITEFADAKRDEGRSYQEYLDNKIPIETWQHVDQIAEKYFNKMLKYLDSLREATIADDKPATSGDKIRQRGNQALLDYRSNHKCDICIYAAPIDSTPACTRPDGKSCMDGMEAWLNAPAE